MEAKESKRTDGDGAKERDSSKENQEDKEDGIRSASSSRSSFVLHRWIILKSELLAQEKRKKEKRKKRHSLRPPFLWSTLKVQMQLCVGM